MDGYFFILFFLLNEPYNVSLTILQLEERVEFGKKARIGSSVKQVRVSLVYV